MIEFIYSLYIKLTSIGFLKITDGTTDKFMEIQKQFEGWINGFIGLTFLTSIIILLIHTVKLANAGNNAQKRSQILRDIGITFLTTAILGGLSTFYVLIFYFGLGFSGN